MLMFGRGPHGVGSPEITELERRSSGHVMFGRVSEVDYAKALVRVAIGDEDDDEGHLVTGWLPMGAGRAGGDRDWHPLEVDERVVVLSESGDTPNGLVIPVGFYTGDAPAPGNKAGLWRKSFKDGGTVEYDRDSGAFLVDAKQKATLRVGDASVEVASGSVKLSVGGVSLTVSSSGVAISGNFSADGGSFKHSGTNVGSSHKHSKVQVGTGISDVPLPG